MTGTTAAAVVMVAAALVVGLPSRRARQRLDRLRGRSGGSPVAPLKAALTDRPRRSVVLASAAMTAVGLVAAGPVAGAVLGAYAGAGTRAAVRAVLGRERDRRLARALDAVSGMAADLRAGARRDVQGEWTAVPEVAQRVSAAVALADETGAPLADVLDRLEADLRAGARARTAALAQAAGAKASAVLLAVLPVAGLAIGFAIGADPLAVLLRTPLGAACLVGAVLLQLAGLGWSAWLVRIGTLT